MRKKKCLRIGLIGLVGLALVGGLGLFIWSKTGTYPAGAAALSALESSGSVNVTRDKWIVFSPSEPARTGLIFYPGGLVEPGAYAPVLRQIAENGVLVVITPMPFNLAIFNTGAANDVINAYPSIDIWVLAGHSLGGASAAIFAENNPRNISAIAFWDSYPPNSADLSDNLLRVLSIYGTTNGFPNTDNLDDKRALLPEQTIYTPLEGANHAQFGDYGPQKNDVAASISSAEQHDRVTDIMLSFILPGH